MPVELLKTKLFIPSPKMGLVSRPRLTSGLANAPDCKLAIISAPADFGKTTLLGTWINGLNEPVAWLSIDKNNYDDIRFWSYFITALQTVHPEIGRNSLTALEYSSMPQIESNLTSLINELTDISELSETLGSSMIAGSVFKESSKQSKSNILPGSVYWGQVGSQLYFFGNLKPPAVAFSRTIAVRGQGCLSSCPMRKA